MIKRTFKQAEAAAADWNSRAPIGTRVRYHGLGKSRPSVATRTRTEAWALPGGSVVVALEGAAGGVSIDRLEILEAPSASEGNS